MVQRSIRVALPISSSDCEGGLVGAHGHELCLQPPGEVGKEGVSTCHMKVLSGREWQGERVYSRGQQRSELGQVMVDRSGRYMNMTRREGGREGEKDGRERGREERGREGGREGGRGE